MRYTSNTIPNTDLPSAGSPGITTLVNCSFLHLRRSCTVSCIAHSIDPLDFDQKCDGSLPLEDMLRPNTALRRLFEDIDRSKARVWALTNAYVTVSDSVGRTP